MYTRSIRKITASLRTVTKTTTTTSKRIQPRFFSSTTSKNNDATPPPGSLNHREFYKTFGRPIAKVFLMAIFTYQLAYYFWVKLEQDETKAEMQATISDLEAKIESLEKTKEKRS